MLYFCQVLDPKISCHGETSMPDEQADLVQKYLASDQRVRAMMAREAARVRRTRHQQVAWSHTGFVLLLTAFGYCVLDAVPVDQLVYLFLLGTCGSAIAGIYFSYMAKKPSLRDFLAEYQARQGQSPPK